MYSAEHRFTNLLNDRLMIPHDVGVLYVDSQGAGSPQGNCRDSKRVKACEGQRPQADSSTSRPE